MNALLRRNDLFAPLQAEFDRFFDEFFRDKRPIVTHLKNSGYPKMDVTEEHDRLTVRLAVPGMKKDDMDVTCTKEGWVCIRGRMSREYVAGDEAEVYVKELRTSAFERSFRLPETVLTHNDPEASLRDGILTLVWPTEDALGEEPGPEPKKINIMD
jgi:HSP20 family protein